MSNLLSIKNHSITGDDNGATVSITVNRAPVSRRIYTQIVIKNFVSKTFFDSLTCSQKEQAKITKSFSYDENTVFVEQTITLTGVCLQNIIDNLLGEGSLEAVKSHSGVKDYVVNCIAAIDKVTV